MWVRFPPGTQLRVALCERDSLGMCVTRTSIDSLSPESSPLRGFVDVARLPSAPFPPGTICTTRPNRHESSILKYMKTPLRTLLTVLFLAVLAPCYATDIVRIDAKYKKDALTAPDPD